MDDEKYEKQKKKKTIVLLSCEFKQQCNEKREKEGKIDKRIEYEKKTMKRRIGKNQIKKF